LQNKYDLSLYKKILKIALPIALQSLISSSLVLLDNLMVSSLGELSLSAVGLSAQVFSVEWMIVFGFCTGCATFFTQLWGIKDLKRIRKVIGIALLSCLCFGIVFFCLSLFIPVSILSLFTNAPEAAQLGAVYLRTAAVNFILAALIQPFSTALRATQQTRLPMYISIGAFVCDAVFNYLLIFGKFGFPALGVKGAAIATVLARVFEFVLTLIVVFWKKNIIAGHLKDFFDFDFNFVKRVFSNACFACLSETGWGTAVVFINAAYGHLGVTAYAAVQSTATIMDLFQMACFCMGDASIILIGEQLGRGNTKEGKDISVKVLKFSAFIGTVMMLLLIAFSNPMLSLFHLTELGRSLAQKLLLIRAVVLPLNLLNGIIIAGIFRAGGDASFAAISEMLSMWCLAVPAAFICSLVLKLPVYIVMLAVNAETVIKLGIMFKRYLSGKWLKNMISDM